MLRIQPARTVFTSVAFLLNSLSFSFVSNCRVPPGHRGRWDHWLRQWSWTPIYNSSPGLRGHFLLPLSFCSNPVVFGRTGQSREDCFPLLDVAADTATMFISALLGEGIEFLVTDPLLLSTLILNTTDCLSWIVEYRSMKCIQALSLARLVSIFLYTTFSSGKQLSWDRGS